MYGARGGKDYPGKRTTDRELCGKRTTDRELCGKRTTDRELCGKGDKQVFVPQC